MKKIYMMPSTIVVKIQSQFICTSPTGNGRSVSGNSVSGGAQLSRESSDWDDEE